MQRGSVCAGRTTTTCRPHDNYDDYDNQDNKNDDYNNQDNDDDTYRERNPTGICDRVQIRRTSRNPLV